MRHRSTRWNWFEDIRVIGFFSIARQIGYLRKFAGFLDFVDFEKLLQGKLLTNTAEIKEVLKLLAIRNRMMYNKLYFDAGYFSSWSPNGFRFPTPAEAALQSGLEYRRSHRYDQRCSQLLE